MSSCSTDNSMAMYSLGRHHILLQRQFSWQLTLQFGSHLDLFFVIFFFFGLQGRYSLDAGCEAHKDTRRTYVV